MRKYLRKISAILMTAIMVLSMCVPTLAEAGVAPKPTDKAAATVTKVEGTATVTAYKIIEANYNTNGFTGYSPVEGVKISNIKNPTAGEITEIAKKINNNNNNNLSLVSERLDRKGTADEEGLFSYSKELTAGMWMVLVTGDVKEVYNPMIVSVYYSVGGNNNEMAAGTVDASSDWELNGQTVYAKSTKPFIEKTIINSGSGTSKGDDKAVGDTVQFQIKTQVPSYSEEYSNADVALKIRDELSQGLTLKHGADEITVTGVPKGNYTLNATDNGFIIQVDSAWALKNGKQDITVTYSAVINDKAKVNFNPDTNIATLEYKNKSGVQTVTDKTYHYTFGIGAALTGQTTTKWEDIRKEIIKTGEERIIKNDKGKEIKTNTLPGATFTLTRLDKAEYDSENKQWTATPYSGDGSKKQWTATSGEDGRLEFTGLDAGWYELEETQAPSGYTLEGKKHYVHISATYKTDGRLESYNIAIDNQNTSEYTAHYEGETTTVSSMNIVDGSVQIPNTKISELPSTGGTGTYIFTVLGVMVMTGVAGMFFASRRKENE